MTNNFKKTIYVNFIFLLLISCKDQIKETSLVSNEPKTYKTFGYLVSKDSIQEPEIVLAGKSELLNVENKLVVPSQTNTHIATPPKIVPAGKPYTAIPGTAIFLEPVTCGIIDTIVPYIPSEPIPSQRPRFKDDASCNIQYFDVDQGLPSSYIHKILEDRFGNIWFCSSNGLIKFDGKSYSTFTEKEGFFGGTLVRGIYEDQKGNLWLGSARGACKYDGKTFTYYDQKKGGMDNIVRSIIEDKKGNLWFAGEKGISCFDGNKFTCYSEKHGLVDENAFSLLCDRLGNIWIGTTGGISKFDGKSFTSYTTNEGLYSNFVSSIGEDKEGNIWMAGGALCKFDGSSFFHYTEKEGVLNGDTRGMAIDNDGDVWVASYGKGVNKFDEKKFTYLTHKEGLTIDNVWSVMADKTGNIWVGTDGGGVCKYLSKSFSHFTEKQGMGHTVMSIAEDNEQNIWLGAYANGLWKYDGNSFSLFNDKTGTFGTIRSIFKDKSGNMWFGSEGGGIVKKTGNRFERYTIKQGLIGNVVHCIIEDDKNNLWIGTSGGLSKFDGENFTNYTTKQGLCSNGIPGVIQDKKGNIWIATSKGVNKLVAQDKSMLRFTMKEGLSNNNVRNILEDNNGNIWIGTGEGLNVYDGSTITNYTVKEGLSNDYIRSLVEDKPQNLPKGMIGIWASTDNGINHLLIGSKYFSDTDSSQKEVKIIIHKREDGLKGEDFTSNSGFQDSKSRIWWGSVKSLTMVDASTIISENEIPQIKLTDIKLEQKFIDFRSLKDSIQNKKDWYVDEKKDINLSKIDFADVPAFYNYPLNAEFPYNINNIEFNFSSVDWNSPHKLRYQFILEGFDKEWHPVTSETKAVYTSLGSGDYIFKVKAKGFSDIWSEPFEYSFVIHPPLWQTTWAYSTYILVFIFGTFLVFKWRTKALVVRQKELESTIVERTADVVEEKNKVLEKNIIIENKQKEIIDSIMYARRIQDSLSPTEKYIDTQLKRLKK